jgi:hypothetical protein
MPACIGAVGCGHSICAEAMVVVDRSTTAIRGLRKKAATENSYSYCTAGGVSIESPKKIHRSGFDKRCRWLGSPRALNRFIAVTEHRILTVVLSMARE